MATTTDYDAPRGTATDVESDSIEELKAAVASINLTALEALKNQGVKKG